MDRGALRQRMRVNSPLRWWRPLGLRCALGRQGREQTQAARYPTKPGGTFAGPPASQLELDVKSADLTDAPCSVPLTNGIGK